MASLAFNPLTGVLYGQGYSTADGEILYIIDPNTAATKPVGATADFFNGLEFNATGSILYGWGNDNSTMYKIDLNTLELTPLFQLPAPYNDWRVSGLAIDGMGNFYVSGAQGGGGGALSNSFIAKLDPNGNLITIRQQAENISGLVYRPIADQVPTLTEWGVITLTIVLAAAASFRVRSIGAVRA